jgi:hypothetical protein
MSKIMHNISISTVSPVGAYKVEEKFFVGGG